MFIAMDTSLATTAATSDYKEKTLQRGLSPRHREAMRLIAAGMSLKDVANRLGYSKSRLWQITHSPLWLREMAKLQARLDADTYEIMLELRKLHPKVVNTYESILDTDPNLFHGSKVQVAKDILDRTGIIPGVASVTQQTTYEEQLAKTTVTYKQELPAGYTPCIEVIGGMELVDEDQEDKD